MHRHGPVLLPVLASLLLALGGCGTSDPASDVITVRVLDERGQPAPWARVLHGGSTGDAGGLRMRWDADRALVTLPRASAPHTLQVAAPGRKTMVVDGITADRTIALELGYPIEIHVTGDASPPEAPRIILFRLRPVTEQDPATDDAAAVRVSDVCSMIYPRHGATDTSLPLLPRGRWGFAATADDAEHGLLLPEPGEYEVRWGLFDTAEGTWQSSAGAANVLQVEAHGREAQRLDVRIDAGPLQIVRRALRAQLDALEAARAEREAAASGSETTDDDAR
ncbi:MAG: hypothetical protein H6806_10195 [Planctomycetes bacterium]|nr:hypothetical protein [Planctomycetota bacterium]MCB9824640.1 hypothetical protein [Planctomycetota bacterium]MCB9830115.1 hypothetical protein [Planctomycetota bacterium]MCB9899948.1 hypothetical protein [Planctomycetota bacterium]